MWSFCSLCEPSAAVEAPYGDRFWAPLRSVAALRIGIQIRFGDATMGHQGGEQLQRARRFFQCAERIEAAHALPGQRVVWYLMSDSAVLRRAAPSIFGAKLLTDADFSGVHTDCKRNANTSACTATAMGDALRHAVGSMLTFSLADYHVITARSGFGRAAAWLSGRRNNIFEVAAAAVPAGDEAPCDPLRPTSHTESSQRWSGI
jgi:hypothetical protein